MAENEEDAIELQLFHNTVREHIIFLLLFLLLYLFSYVVVSRLQRKDQADLYSNEKDEMLVYRISNWLCVFSVAIAGGAALLLPISIVSNEVLILYPNSYYVKWLNSSLVQGLWNQIFLYSNLSLFVFLPFAYLFTESTGFFGQRKGIAARLYETFIVFTLLAVAVLSTTYVLSAVIEPHRIGFLSFLNLSTIHLRFLYSCISLLGVMMLLVCTPYGFVCLFGIMGQVLARPLIIRNIDEHYAAFYMEEASIKRKIAAFDRNQLCARETESTGDCVGQVGKERRYQNSLLKIFARKSIVQHIYYEEREHIEQRLKALESKRSELEKLRKATTFERRLVYPLAILLLVFLATITILLVVQNTLELLIGIKALPLSSRKFTLGITSLSKLGPFGAGLEVCLIFYLGITSAVGLYSMPLMQKVRPLKSKTSLPKLILNCALLLILSSAQPLLSRIIGITNFDLLGNFGALEWLGNFQLVLFYNMAFGSATTLCLANKFTSSMRRELYARLLENYSLLKNYISCMN